MYHRTRLDRYPISSDGMPFVHYSIHRHAGVIEGRERKAIWAGIWRGTPVPQHKFLIPFDLYHDNSTLSVFLPFLIQKTSLHNLPKKMLSTFSLCCFVFLILHGEYGYHGDYGWKFHDDFASLMCMDGI